eukprot:NODE_5762_length_557_cov_162.679283.p1 GENE.NODE_5762_length_557_cov_162.679283~~NODE_5762_length_557_cov_162.679283.p1  ORF type:complete len:100 (+),score=5.20 NODE_5762_length_557_cov_162.679283:234-533(+)
MRISPMGVKLMWVEPMCVEPMRFGGYGEAAGRARCPRCQGVSPGKPRIEEGAARQSFVGETSRELCMWRAASARHTPLTSKIAVRAATVVLKWPPCTLR